MRAGPLDQRRADAEQHGGKQGQQSAFECGMCSVDVMCRLHVQMIVLTVVWIVAHGETCGG